MSRFPNINLNFLRNLILGVFVVSFFFSLGYLLGIRGLIASSSKFPEVSINRILPPEKEKLDFGLFWRVWDTLHEKYYDKSKLIDSEMVYGAIKGMVSAIGDPYTTYLPPAENKIFQEDLQGTFEGVGIQIGFKGNQLVVIAPLPNSPAEKKGIKAGDFIVRIKDESRGIDMATLGITLPEAVQAIRGKAGTSVKLTLVREGEQKPIEVVVVREAVNVPSVVVEYIESGSIAHIKILKFSKETLKEWENTIAELLLKRNLSGIILDVRNNPGGLLDDAIEIASDFLDSGRVVVIEEKGDGTRSEYRVKKLGRLKNYKLAVLLNEGSASASEILAGALKDNGKAKLIGETTFGKGTIQEPVQIEGNGGLNITIARWLTPSGFWVNDGGLKPDIEVKDNEETSEDEQLLEAVEILKS